MATTDLPSLGKTQHAALVAATRHGLFRVSSVWRAKGVRRAISAATVDALVEQGCLRLDGEAATLTNRGRNALRCALDRKSATLSDDGSGSP